MIPANPCNKVNKQLIYAYVDLKIVMFLFIKLALHKLLITFYSGIYNIY